MKKWLKRIAIVCGIIFVLPVVVAGIIGLVWMNIDSPTPPPPVAAAPPPPVCQVNAEKLLGYVQAERSKLGVPLFAVEPKLVTASQDKLNLMIEQKYFAHHLPDNRPWSVFIRAQGIRAGISEDIGSSDLTPEQSWEEFKKSPDHYASLTSSEYTRVGAAAQCTDYTVEKAVDEGGDTLVGQKITDLTIISLAGNEPVAPAAQTTSQGCPVTTCNDGSCSSSTGRGTCSWHGGVAHY